MVRQIDLKRRHGHEPLRGCMKICALRIVHRRACRANPVHGLAARTGLFDDRFRGMTAAQATQLDVTDVLIRSIGNIDVQ